MSVIADEDDLEREALDLYKECLAEVFREHLGANDSVALGDRVRDFETIEGLVGRELAGTCLALISNFAEAARSSRDGEGEESAP